MIEQLIHRLTKHHSNIDEFKMLFNSSLPSNEVIAYVKNHFTKRREVFELEVGIFIEIDKWNLTFYEVLLDYWRISF